MYMFETENLYKKSLKDLIRIYIKEVTINDIIIMCL